MPNDEMEDAACAVSGGAAGSVLPPLDLGDGRVLTIEQYERDRAKDQEDAKALVLAEFDTTCWLWALRQIRNLKEDRARLRRIERELIALVQVK